MCAKARTTHARGNSRFKLASDELIDAFDVARDCCSDRWEFAVELDCLLSLGLSKTDLRWLVKKGYVEHAREITELRDLDRRFANGSLMFDERTCFVLTEAGFEEAQKLGVLPSADRTLRTEEALTNVTPTWQSETRELRWKDRVVKRLKWRAVNQITVLCAFQEEGWKEVIDDPLPPSPEQDSKGRLHDTIKALNRHQDNKLLRFGGIGTGEAIRWQLIEDNGQ